MFFYSCCEKKNLFKQEKINKDEAAKPKREKIENAEKDGKLLALKKATVYDLKFNILKPSKLTLAGEVTN